MQALNCNYFNTMRCRSCNLLQGAKGKTLGEIYQPREEEILKLFSEYFGSDTFCHELFTPEHPFHSRSKAKLTVSGNLEVPIIGLFTPKFKGIELTKCPLHLNSINRLMSFLPSIITKYSLTPYFVKKRTGELKGVIVQADQAENNLMLRFVVKSTELIEKIKSAIPEIQSQFPTVKVITANIQPIPHQILEGEEEIVLTNESLIWENYNGIKVAVAHKSFLQVTPEVAEGLYGFVEKVIEKKSAKSVLDLYCGVGGFALHAGRVAKKVVGIELSQEAINCAELSAKTNSLDNVKFLCQNLDQSLEESISKISGLSEVDTVICNPPRRGLDDAVINFLLSTKPETIIYSSCKPETLHRDFLKLSEFYAIKEFAPFDMFPLTNHCEVVLVLERK
jgi:23S rRNA (uracil747-C5)-methyltransferase